MSLISNVAVDMAPHMHNTVKATYFAAHLLIKVFFWEPDRVVAGYNWHAGVPTKVYTILHRLSTHKCGTYQELCSLYTLLTRSQKPSKTTKSEKPGFSDKNPFFFTGPPFSWVSEAPGNTNW